MPKYKLSLVELRQYKAHPAAVQMHGIVCYLETSSCITSDKMESVPALYVVQQMMTTLETIYFSKPIGSLNAWFVHLSEGVDQSSKAEFDALWDKGLIMDETVVIHGTGMDASQFNQMGTTGAGLVWSPFSNLVLYGDTTDVVAADNAGITISIAPDWGPSGTKNNLHELKVADMWNREIYRTISRL